MEAALAAAAPEAADTRVATDPAPALATEDLEAAPAAAAATTPPPHPSAAATAAKQYLAQFVIECLNTNPRLS